MTHYLHLALNSLALDTRSLITAMETECTPCSYAQRDLFELNLILNPSATSLSQLLAQRTPET